MRIFTFIFVIAGIFLVSFLAARDGWFRRDYGNKVPDRNPFQFRWEHIGKGGQWKLAIKPARFESFLLVKHLDPAFEGLSPPEIISSTEEKIFASQVLQNVVGISTTTMSSYARLPDDYSQVGRLELSFPLAGCGEIVQVDSKVEAGSRLTHTLEAGMIHAVDIKADMGTTVVAAISGRVVYVESRHPDLGRYETGSERLDNRVVVKSENGTESVYAHLMQGSVVVVEGEFVNAGTPLASVGNSGFSQNPHLHFHVGGLNIHGYQTMPVDFLIDGERVRPEVGRRVCNLR